MDSAQRVLEQLLELLSKPLTSRSGLLHRVSPAQTQDSAFASAAEREAAFTVFEPSGLLQPSQTAQL